MVSKRYAKIKIWHAIRRTIVTIAMLAMVAFLINVAPNYIKDDQEAVTKLIINTNNVTSNLKSDIIMQDDEIYLSIEDVRNFFDEYITMDDTQIITTSNTKTVAIPKKQLDESHNVKIYENGSHVTIKNGAIYRNGSYYLPMNSLSEVYNYEIKYVESARTIIVNSLSKKLVQATCAKNISVKYKATSFSKTIEKAKRGDLVSIVQDTKTNTDFEIDGWVRVLTNNGKLGYLKKSDLINETNIRENMDENRIKGKVSLVWDYYAQGEDAPTMTEKIDGVNVVSPSFYNVNSSGTINVSYGDSGKKYVEWAHTNGYDVWPTISNSSLNNLDAVSDMFSTFENRSKLIDSIINSLIDVDVDGVNIDFENMYKADKDNYSRFIIELAPRLQDIGMKMCVDVTSPDGSDTWSLCYDRNTLGKVTDYMVFIAYDQHGVTTATSVAAANWIELNINKFIGQEGVPAEKLIVAMPFYTRLWKESDGNVTSKVVNMKNITIPEGVNKIWNDSTKQNYIEYTQDGLKYKMWIEDIDSLNAKLDLINKYNLSGAGFWEKGRETEDVWTAIKTKLNL